MNALLLIAASPSILAGPLDVSDGTSLGAGAAEVEVVTAASHTTTTAGVGLGLGLANRLDVSAAVETAPETSQALSLGAKFVLRPGAEHDARGPDLAVELGAAASSASLVLASTSAVPTGSLHLAASVEWAGADGLGTVGSLGLEGPWALRPVAEVNTDGRVAAGLAYEVGPLALGGVGAIEPDGLAAAISVTLAAERRQRLETIAATDPHTGPEDDS